MKLTTMKISVPVLMLMMFQSGYGVSDWFEKAWGLMNQGKKAEAYAVVKQAHPEKVKPIYDQDRQQCLSVWSKAVSDAVSKKLPLCYYDRAGKLTTEGKLNGEALRNEIITLNDQGIISKGEYYYFIKYKDNEITPEDVKEEFLNETVENVRGYLMDENQPSAWLLPDDNLLAKYVTPTEPTENENKGVRAWAGRIAAAWQTGEGEDVTTHNKNLLRDKEGADTDLCVINLRNEINLTNPNEGSGDLDTVYGAIETEALEAHNAVSSAVGQEAETAAVEALAESLRNVLKDVLVGKIKEATDPQKKDNLKDYLKVAFNRNVVDGTSKTVKPYSSEHGLLESDPLDAILAVADNPQVAVDDVIDIYHDATKQVIADDLFLLLRRDGEKVDINDDAIINDEHVEYLKFKTFLENNAQPLADDVTDSVVENLQLIQANWVEPDSGDESD